MTFKVAVEYREIRRYLGNFLHLHHYNNEKLHKLSENIAYSLITVHNYLINPHKTSLSYVKDPKIAILRVE